MILLISTAKQEHYNESDRSMMYFSEELRFHWGLKRRFEKITGHPCLIVHYSNVSIDLVERYGIKAIFIAGFMYRWKEISIQSLFNVCKLIREIKIPLLGSCGGLQLINIAFSKNPRKTKKLSDAPIRKLKPGEPDIWPEYYPGYFKKHGIYRVKIIRQDPIFNGVSNKISVPEYRYSRIKKFPGGFILLATNNNNEIQAVRHKILPVYGTQFQLERWSKNYPDGKKIITNFFRIAKLC